MKARPVDTLFDDGFYPSDGGLFTAADAAGRADGLGIRRFAAGDDMVTFLRSSDGVRATGAIVSDGPEPRTVHVAGTGDHHGMGMVIVDTTTFLQRTDLE